METLIRISDALRRFVEFIGQCAKWLIIPMIAITIWDVVTRKFFSVQIFFSGIVGDLLNSTKLQEMEWHLHTALFALCLGFGYLRNAHVRVDLVAEMRSPRWRAWIEFLGCILFLLPYCLLVIYFAYDFVLKSYLQGEISASLIGLPHRWVIKSVLMVGLVLALLAGISVLLRYIVVLFGSGRAAEAPFERKKPLIEPVI
jgi:TRAP-type mannitol/chloroaromatic compound transport system permease small subunit